MTGYCTIEDVRQVLQQAEFTAPLDANSHGIVVDAIAGVSGEVERATKRHWYVSGGVSPDEEGLIPTSSKTRDDEHDIPTHGGFVHGASEQERFRYGRNTDALLEAGPRDERRRRHHRDRKQEIRIAFGEPSALEPPVDDSIPAYTRIQLDRKDVEAVNTLNVVNDAGGFDDWTGGSYTGGVGNTSRGDDWWVRVNNRGVSELYLDVHAMADDIASFSSAVYVDIDYGKDELPEEIRRAVAHLAAAEIVVDEEFQTSIADNGQLINVETKAERWERHGWRKLKPHLVEDPREE